MKKHLTGAILAVAAAVAAPAVSADGITSTNYSATQIMTGNRNASTGPEAAYFNPAGTAWGREGFTFEASNLMSPYTEDKISDSVLGDYKKTSSSWFFPSINLSYKKDNWAVFSSLAPSQAGGAGTLPDGAPTLAWGAASQVAANLVSAATAYAAGGDTATAGVLAAQATAIKAGNFTVEQSGSGGMGSVGASLGGAWAFNDRVSVALGGRYVYQWNHMEATVTSLTVSGTTYAVDAKLDYDQTGTCFGFIGGVDYRALKNVLVTNTLQYYTPLVMTTKVNNGRDGGGFVTDGATSQATYSPEWSVGVSYAPVPSVVVTVDSNLFFNRLVDTDFQDEYADLTWNGGAGVEWQVWDRLKLGTGFTYSPNCQKSNSETDLNYSFDRLWCNLGATLGLTDDWNVTVAAQGAFNLGETKGTGSAGEAQTYSTTSLPFTLAVGTSYHL